MSVKGTSHTIGGNGGIGQLNEAHGGNYDF